MLPYSSMLFFRCFFAYFFITLTSCKISAEFPVILKQIPKYDQENIEELFDFLIKKECFGHTLFGEKPVSLATISIHRPLISITSDEIICRLPRKQSPFWFKWLVWKRYQRLFEFDKYLILEENLDHSNMHVKYIILINKDVFIKTIQQHQKLFFNILGNDAIAEKIFSKIKSEESLNSVIQNNQLLLGILLGYGEHNSQLYYKRHQLKILKKIYQSLFISNSYIFAKLDRSVERINKKLQVFDNYSQVPLLYGSVKFVAEHSHPETLFLKSKYKESQKILSNTYSGKNRFETTLLQLLK